MSIRPTSTTRRSGVAGGDRLRRLGLPLAAGALVALGTLAIVGTGDDTTGAANVDLIPTLVARQTVPAGTDRETLIDRLEVRMLPDEARADGVIESIDDLPDGVLVIDLVPGQQVLATSIADDVVAAIADDYVAVSVRLDPQRWTGPFSVTGADVDLYDNREESTGLLVKHARIIDAPDTTELDARSEAVITLAVPADDVGAVIDAAANGRLWAVGS
jgi:hypothetical protein